MKRIFISGGITNVPDYMTEFKKAENELREIGYKSIINPAYINSHLPVDLSYDDYMAISIAELSVCEAIYMLRNWKESKGAVREHRYASMNGLEIIYQ
jgi:hypothetical protein